MKSTNSLNYQEVPVKEPDVLILHFQHHLSLGRLAWCGATPTEKR